MGERFVISYAAAHYADADWSQFAERWTATFYTASVPNIGTATITRVIPGVTPNPRRAYEVDPGLLDRIPRVIFTEDGGLVPELVAMRPTLLLLLESVHVADEWRGKGVGMELAVTALRRLAVPGTVAVCYPAPIHDHGPDEPCSYQSDDPEIRRPDEEAVTKLQQAWQRHGFKEIDEGVHARQIEP
jgi:GNAT superfamily N-acetyltransferase